MKRMLCLIVVALTLAQCTSIIESSFESSLTGTWIATTMEDVATGNIVDTEDGGFINVIFGNVSANAFAFEDENVFYTFFHPSGTVTQNGTWKYEFGNIDIDFDNGKEIKQLGFGLKDGVLTFQDTIFGRAKVISFIKDE